MKKSKMDYMDEMEMPGLAPPAGSEEESEEELDLESDEESAEASPAASLSDDELIAEMNTRGLSLDASSEESDVGPELELDEEEELDLDDAY